MKTKHYLLLVVAGMIAIFTGFLLGRCTHTLLNTVTETIETKIDTIAHRAPMQQSELALGTRVYTFPVYRVKTVKSDSADINGGGAGGEPRCSNDSAMVELPEIQRHYADSTYEAWVSGPIDPRLDSINVFARTSIITKREWKPPKRWHIGVTAGYGYGAKGFQPYIGVGITYSIISF